MLCLLGFLVGSIVFIALVLFRDVVEFRHHNGYYPWQEHRSFFRSPPYQVFHKDGHAVWVDDDMDEEEYRKVTGRD